MLGFGTRRPPFIEGTKRKLSQSSFSLSLLGVLRTKKRDCYGQKPGSNQRSAEGLLLQLHQIPPGGLALAVQLVERTYILSQEHAPGWPRPQLHRTGRSYADRAWCPRPQDRRLSVPARFSEPPGPTRAREAETRPAPTCARPRVLRCTLQRLRERTSAYGPCLRGRR